MNFLINRRKALVDNPLGPLSVGFPSGALPEISAPFSQELTHNRATLTHRSLLGKKKRCLPGGSIYPSAVGRILKKQ
jgi:hypothetical protein